MHFWFLDVAISWDSSEVLDNKVPVMLARMLSLALMNWITCMCGWVDG